jgi:hypothetical protein
MLVAAAGPLIDGIGKWKHAALAGALALVIVPNLSHLHPAQALDIDPTLWTPQQIAQRGIEVSSFGEYRPRWMQDWPVYDPRPAEIVAGYAGYQQTGKGPTWWNAVFDASVPATVQLNTAFFPGWRLRIDGAPAKIWTSDGPGKILFQIPSGHHVAAIDWTRTRALWVADVVSLLALGFWILAFLPAARPQEAPAVDIMKTAHDLWPASPKTWR